MLLLGNETSSCQSNIICCTTDTVHAHVYISLTSHLSQYAHHFISPHKYVLDLQDKSFEDQLKAEYPDASRATILECDDENCVQVQCVQMPNGEWKCDEGLEGSGATSKTVLMVSEDDD